MKRYLYGISVRGASHIRKGKECQDSCRVERLSDSAAVIAAADGHGSDSCPFSRIGAGIAVEVFCSSMKDSACQLVFFDRRAEKEEFFFDGRRVFPPREMLN